MRLKDKVAIITGSGSGIGRAAALIFAREGAKVVVADINESSAKKTVEEIEAKGGEAISFQVDITVESQVKQMTQAAKEKFGKLDILFNNAGMQNIGTVLEVAVPDFSAAGSRNTWHATPSCSNPNSSWCRKCSQIPSASSMWPSGRYPKEATSFHLTLDPGWRVSSASWQGTSVLPSPLPVQLIHTDGTHKTAICGSRQHSLRWPT